MLSSKVLLWPVNFFDNQLDLLCHTKDIKKEFNDKVEYFTITKHHCGQTSVAQVEQDKDIKIHFSLIFSTLFLNFNNLTLTVSPGS